MSQSRPFRFSALAALGAVAAIALGACSGGSAPTAAESGTQSGSADSALTTVTPGKLTIATGEPAYEPWVLNDDPASCEGFEAAVACAIAEKLGFTKDNVVWTRSTFDAAIAPGAKDWDFNFQQFSITDERKNAVDFSSPYYTTSQAVVALKDSPAANAKTMADLKDVQFGVQAGTTSQIFLTEKVETSKDPLIFNSSQDVVQAINGGQVDAIVVDLPTAFYIVATQLEKGTVVGQFADTTDGDNYGFILPKGSPLTAAVTKAMDELRADGTLEQLQTKWLSEATNVPVLK